jgi:hypothetical protein
MRLRLMMATVFTLASPALAAEEHGRPTATWSVRSMRRKSSAETTAWTTSNTNFLSSACFPSR